MIPRPSSPAKLRFLVALSAGLFILASCSGGGGGGSASNSLTSSANNTSVPPVNNALAISVSLGPAGNFPNGVFASATVCAPGSSTACQTINNLLVDTGSEGLRILSSELTVTLPPETGLGGNALQECVQFADGSYVWGPVVTADIQLAGEKATSVPIQIISASPPFPAPSSCTSGGGGSANTIGALGATGILGVGNFRQDCGLACSTSTSPDLYFICPNSSCQSVTVTLGNQVQNPVWLFTQDNNGVLVSLPSVPATGALTASGSLFFGIGTQSNNALGSAKIYTTDAGGNFRTTYPVTSGTTYTDSYIDSGSNALYFLSASTLGITECGHPNEGFYCPSSTMSFTATTTGLNGNSAQISFSIANADSLFRTNNAAFNDLGGDFGTSTTSSNGFAWGLPFFFGRNVFVGIEDQAAPNGVRGPYWAY